MSDQPKRLSDHNPPVVVEDCPNHPTSRDASPPYVRWRLTWELTPDEDGYVPVLLFGITCPACRWQWSSRIPMTSAEQLL